LEQLEAKADQEEDGFITVTAAK